MSSCRRAAWVVVLLLSLAVTAFSAGPLVSVVLKNGQRFSGTLVAQRSDRVFLEIDSREYSWSQNEIAAIEFAPGRPNRRELSSLSSVPSQFEGGPAATLVLQDGQVVTGRFGGIQNDGRTVRIFTSGRNRTDVSSGDIARLYLDAATARSLYASNAVVDAYPQAAPPVIGGAEPAGPFNVDARQEWTRTRVIVRQGERLSFESSGQVRWGSGQGQVAGPEGADIQASERRNYPVPQWGVGALVARVGDGRPFAIGSSSDPIVMPADGELYLGVNDSARGDNSGSFLVRIARAGRYARRPGGYRSDEFDFASATPIRVDSRQAWTQTNVTVRQGERLAFQATGQVAWGRAASQVAGPEGAYIEDSVRRNYPLPSAGVGALLGRIDDGPPFLVGAGTEPIVMPADGQLYLGVNDSGRGDNSGSFAVRVARSSRYAGRPGGVYGQDQRGLATVSVDARQEWTPTNLTVRQGEQIAFQATGQIGWGRAANQVAGPGGAEVETFSRWAYPVPSAGVGALVGRIDDGVPFLVGAGTGPITMPADGQLYLGVNDASRGDNSGAFTVRIIRSTRYSDAQGAGYEQDQVDFASATPVRVDAREAWTETDVMVRRGERVAFQATGQIAWGRGATQVTGPEGAPVQAAGRRNYAVPSAGVGAVVGRIDDGPPFLVGANSEPIVMPADGRLYLGINDSGRGNNSGFFLVRVARVQRR